MRRKHNVNHYGKQNKTKWKCEEKQFHQIFPTEKELKRRQQYTCETKTTTNNDVTINDQRRQPREHTPQTIQWKTKQSMLRPRTTTMDMPTM